MKHRLDELMVVALLDMHVEALFTHDADGCIMRSNEPHPNRRAPRFFFGRSLGGNRWRFRDDLPIAVVERLDALAAAEPVATDLRSPAVFLDRVRAVLADHMPIADESHGPAYCFPDQVPQPSNVVMIDRTNLALLREMEPDIERFERHIDVMGPCAVVVEDGVAVSMCFSSRFTDNAAEAGLDTLPRARHRGYAVAVTTAWANAVRDLNRVPLYSTSWNNVASQGVARRLGLMQYAQDLSFS